MRYFSCEILLSLLSNSFFSEPFKSLANADMQFYWENYPSNIVINIYHLSSKDKKLQCFNPWDKKVILCFVFLRDKM